MFTSGSERSPSIPTSHHIQHTRCWDFGARITATDSRMQDVPADPTPLIGMSQFLYHMSTSNAAVQHQDLRGCTRMVTHLCEVRSSMRAHRLQAEQLTEQMAQVNQEKPNLRRRLAELYELRKYEKESSLAVETSLHEHCDQAVNCYKSSIE